MTVQQLRKFVRLRNESQFTSNLQFQIDADSAGFSMTELGKAEPVQTKGGIAGYKWTTPHGQLLELSGKLFLEGSEEFNAVKASVL